MALTTTVRLLGRGRPLRPASDLRAVRWAAMLFLLIDSTDIVVGIVAPGPVITRPAPLDVLQTLLGLAACAALLWWRWWWAAPLSAAVATMMLVRQPVGIELSVLFVAAAVLAGALRPRALLLTAPGTMLFAGALGYSLHRANGASWVPVTVAAVLLVALATTVGAVAGRLARDREESRRALLALQAENFRIRTAVRGELAGELQRILTHDFGVMLDTARGMAEPGDVASVRRTIAQLGDLSRSTTASVRLALLALRADLDPPPVDATGSPAWIDALHSRRSRSVLCWASLVLASGALLHVAWSWVTLGSDALTALDAVVVVASPLTVAAALSSTRTGLVMAVVVLAAGLLTPNPSPWLAIPTAVLCFVAARDGRWYWIATVVATVLGSMAVLLAVHRSEAGMLIGVLEGAAIGSVLLGLTVCHFEAVRAATQAELTALHGAQSRIAAEERAGAARELHDVVGHQLSLVCLQSLAAEREEDPEVLGELVRRIQDCLRNGESEISQLVGALHSASDDAFQPPPTLTPTWIATELARQLEGHHCRARFAIDPRVDALDPATRRTMARILQESGTNVLRHAPRGAECTFAATLDEDTVTFLARSPLQGAAPAPHLSGGFGLRGIRERVELTGGSFFAGSRAGWWEVQVSLQTPGRPVGNQVAAPVAER